jgi:3-phosphoglycerate kinase
VKTKTIKDLDLQGKRVLVRVDYNVSLDSVMKISDDFRIKQTLPTIKYLKDKNCTIFLVSHFGRPKGKRDEKFSLEPVAQHLEDLLQEKVHFYSGDYTLTENQKELKDYPEGAVVLLENIRFYPGERANESEFAEQLAALADVVVNDAFGVSHRVHASVVGITKFLPSVAGLLLEKEVEIIGRAIDQPKRPLVAIIGGAKAQTKVSLIGNLLEKADYCLVGGGVANNFLKAWGYEVGKSLVDREMEETARQLFWQAARSNTAMLLPTDVVLGDLEKNKSNGVVPSDQIPKDMQALDIGPKTQAEFGNIISKAGTIIWNGPMGVFEQEKFSNGTEFIYYAIAQNPESMSIVGGGDTLACLRKKQYLQVIDHVSTGGGAMLEFIEKGGLPGIKALERK